MSESAVSERMIALRAPRRGFRRLLPVAGVRCTPSRCHQSGSIRGPFTNEQFQAFPEPAGYVTVAESAPGLPHVRACQCKF